MKSSDLYTGCVANAQWSLEDIRPRGSEFFNLCFEDSTVWDLYYLCIPGTALLSFLIIRIASGLCWECWGRSGRTSVAVLNNRAGLGDPSESDSPTIV